MAWSASPAAKVVPKSAASDTRRLFDSLGMGAFEYRDVAAYERGARTSADARHAQQESDGFDVLPDDSDGFDVLPDPPAAQLPPARERTTPPASAAPWVRNPKQPFTVSVVALKRGVGKKTVVANLATAISQEGRKTLAIDLEAHNELGALFGKDPQSRGGWVRTAFARDRGQMYEYSAECVPFGQCEADALLKLEASLARDPRWFETRLLNVASNDCDVWILNLPAIDGRLLQQALSISDVVVAVVLPDASAGQTISATDAVLNAYLAPMNRRPPFYVINRFDSRRTGDRTGWALLRGNLGTRLLPGVVHEDSAVTEATKINKLVVHAASGSQVVADFAGLADWVLRERAVAEKAAKANQREY